MADPKIPDDDRYSPKKALYAAFPAMKRFSQESDHRVEAMGKLLAQRENRGVDTSFARDALLELRWRTNATSDLESAKRALARLEVALDTADPPTAADQDEEGSFAAGTGVWFLKLDRSTDQLLARQWPWRLAPYFLERIDDPTRMVTYLQDLCWCDVRRRGWDTRKELNLSVSVIARLALRGGQQGYLAGPGIVPAFERFVQDWQDPVTGFFGMTYVVDPQGNEIRTTDLSLTFHMARYAPHLVRDWPKLIDTLFGLRGRLYPEGWLDPGDAMSDHNNYDVAELLHCGWGRMRPDQRVGAAELVAEMLDWCLTASVSPRGEVLNPDPGDMVPDAFYFAAAFLDTIGYFDKTKRFWTERDFPGAETLRNGMATKLRRFNNHLTVVPDTLDRLGRHERRLSNAVL